MLLREFMKERLTLVSINQNHSNIMRTMKIKEDRCRRIRWWAIRQMYRTLERKYRSMRKNASKKERDTLHRWSDASEKCLQAHVKWSTLRVTYQQTHSKLVGLGGAGIGALMLSTVVHGGGGGVVLV